LEVIVLRKHFGPLFRMLHSCTNQSITNALEKMELTAAQGHIMGYLAHRNTPPCSRDIEEAFHLSHPTVSGLLSRLEKKGFIELRPDEQDRRCKRICILPKGQECHERIRRQIMDTEQRLVEGFSPEEQQQFWDFLERALVNLGHPATNYFHKEETNE
jgi:DNA-binding MarR family transcriptional regulator